MKRLRRWFIKKFLTVDDLYTLFNDKGMNISLSFEKQQQPYYYAKNSIIYKRTEKKYEV